MSTTSGPPCLIKIRFRDQTDPFHARTLEDRHDCYNRTVGDAGVPPQIHRPASEFGQDYGSPSAKLGKGKAVALKVDLSAPVNAYGDGPFTFVQGSHAGCGELYIDA